MMHHGKDAQEIRSADESLRHVLPSVRLAQGVGPCLGGSTLLLRSLPQKHKPAGRRRQAVQGVRASRNVRASRRTASWSDFAIRRHVAYICVMRGLPASLSALRSRKSQ